MCGICGIMEFDGRPIDRAVLRAMVRTLRHRGPDGEGCFVEEPVGLGHTRLAVIDLDTGQQPMSTPDGRLTIVFNGEIYNYLELRRQLESSGYTFRTTSDTETILYAYDRWGVDCQTRFNGMWAFALWDAGRHQLLLSRDRLGEKPLHYAVTGGRVLFGSEIKAILAAGLPIEPRQELLELYLAFGTVPAPDTYYRNVYKLRPGCYLVVRDGHVEEGTYWRLPLVTDDTMCTDSEAVDGRFAELFTDAVSLRMRSDVPFGAFLSGGLDSSAVVATMGALSTEPVNTFTVGFDQQAFDERALAGVVAKRFRTRHHELTVAPESLGAALTHTLQHYDEPFGDSSAIPTGAVAREARRHVTVVLTGDGGDEVLSGYTAYQGARFAQAYQHLPVAVQRLLPMATRALASHVAGEARYRLNRVGRVLESSMLDPNAWLIAKFTGGNVGTIDRLLRAYPDRVRIHDYIADAFSDCPYSDHFNRRMLFDLTILLPEDMLTKVDRMSMAYSLECRLPFLDYRLVELLATTHRRVKMAGFERKSILRRTVGKCLPAELLRAPKRGFGVPVREWFKDRMLVPQLDALERNCVGLDSQTVREIIDANRTGGQDYGNFIWMMLVLDSWHRRAEIPKAAAAS